MTAERDELFQLMLGRTTTKAVERILATGYRKPRTITTIEELDALPLGSVVLDDYGVACQVESEWVTEAGPNRMWMTTGCDANTTVALPATVLHIGGTE